MGQICLGCGRIDNITVANYVCSGIINEKIALLFGDNAANTKKQKY